MTFIQMLQCMALQSTALDAIKMAFALVITVIMLGIYRYTAEAAEYMRQNHLELAARDAEIERLKRELAKAVHERH